MNSPLVVERLGFDEWGKAGIVAVFAVVSEAIVVKLFGVVMGLVVLFVLGLLFLLAWRVGLRPIREGEFVIAEMNMQDVRAVVTSISGPPGRRTAHVSLIDSAGKLQVPVPLATLRRPSIRERVRRWLT